MKQGKIRRKRIYVKLPADIIRAVRLIARTQRVTFTRVVEDAIRSAHQTKIFTPQ